MSRRKRTIDRPAASPFRRRGVLIVVMLACGLIWVWFTSGRQGQSPDYRSLEQILAEPLGQGFQILEPPDLPGPYRWLDTRVLFAGDQARITAGGTTRRYSVPDNANREYLAVCLATRDDQPTYAILCRDRPDPDKQEEEKNKLRESLDNQGP